MIEHGPFQNCIMFSDSKKENCAKTLSKTLILIDSDQPHALVLGIVMHCQGLAFELEAFHGWPLEGKESWHPIVMRTLDQLYVVLVSCSLSFDFFSQYHFFQTCVVQDWDVVFFSFKVLWQHPSVVWRVGWAYIPGPKIFPTFIQLIKCFLRQAPPRTLSKS